jgi:GT2 family glycosyltransferase
MLSRAVSPASPSVTLVFLVYNRREELRTSLRQMLAESDYDGAVDAIVVDNASTDGSAEMVRDEFPDVRVITRTENSGVSAWNDGFAVARGDWVLALDDDCYLPPDGLRRAVAAAREQSADLVSFAVESAYDRSVRFDQRYRTGLLTFWGCAVLMRRSVLDELGGFDPEIFIWAHELEFMLRFYDRGFRHLHLPEVVAVHIKRVTGHWTDMPRQRAYKINARHWGYIAAKLFRPRDAAGALVALIALSVRDAVRLDRAAVAAVPHVLRGFAAGLRHRAPLRNGAISHTYRRNFHSFASPWWLSRPLPEIVRRLPVEAYDRARGRTNGAPPPGRRDEYFAERARYYPDRASTLQF